MRRQRTVLSSGHSCREVIRGGESLALHTWNDGRPDLIDLFYIHGLQSHAGWLVETGPALLERGVRLTALDRRGSGLSTGRRGHLDDARLALDDYASVLARVAGAADGPITVIGQSFGASLLAAMVATGRVPKLTRIVLCAPALGQQRARMDDVTRDMVLRRGGDGVSVVEIEDEQYTSMPEYLRMMANDALMVRALTEGFRAAMVEVENLYVAAGTEPWSSHRVCVALPERDAIIDQQASLRMLETLAPHAQIRKFPTNSHYLEFTAVRAEYWDWLAEVTLADATC